MKQCIEHVIGKTTPQSPGKLVLMLVLMIAREWVHINDFQFSPRSILLRVVIATLFVFYSIYYGALHENSD